MHFADAPSEHIQELAERIANGTYTDSDVQELEAAITGDPAARAFYLDYCHLHADLQLILTVDRATEQVREATEPQLFAVSDRLSATEGTSRRSTPQSSFRTFIRQNNFAVAVAVAFASIAAVVAWMSVHYLPGVANKENRPAAAAKDEVVARLTSVRDVEWADGGMPASTRYKPGQRLAFTRGLVEIQYTTGAAVVLEGPAEYYVGGKQKDKGERIKDKEKNSQVYSFENAGYLALGKLVARCETRSSKGFTIATPSGTRAKDLGTEFGVEVNEQGAAEFFVLTGKVELISTRGDGSEQRVLLVKDQGAFVAERRGAIRRRAQVDVRLVAAMQSRLKAIGKPAAVAAVISGVSIHDVSSELAGGNTKFDRAAIHLIDRSGLDGRGHVDAPADGNMWLTTGTFGEPHSKLPAHVVFDLGGHYDVSQLHVWNYNESINNLTSRGAKEVEISVSASDANESFVRLIHSNGDSAFVFLRADGTPDYKGFPLDLHNVTNRDVLANVRYVRFDFTSSHGGNPAEPDDVVGLSEVVFVGTAVDPEVAAVAPARNTETIQKGTTPN